MEEYKTREPDPIANKLDDHGVDREKQEEKMLRFFNTATHIQGFEGKKVWEMFPDEESERKFIEKVDFESFLTLLSGLNGLFKGLPKEKWEIDGDKVYIGSKNGIVEYKPPHPEDKIKLLEKMLDAAKRMNSAGRNLEDIGGLLYSVINSIHPYNDANGRTSRFLYGLMSYNFKGNPQYSEKAARESDRSDIPYSPENIGVDIQNANFLPLITENGEYMRFIPANLNDDSDIFNKKADSGNKKQFLAHYDQDKQFIRYAIGKYLKDHQIKEEEFFKREPGENPTVILDNFLKSLEGRELKEINNNYRKLKKDYIELMIDAFEHPDKNPGIELKKSQ